MDIDMHYYGTYALARAAGLEENTARRVATAAEFVDDATDTEILVHPQGARFRGKATAHHPFDFKANDDLDDQLLVWVPFHFLPGGVGDNQSQRVVCVKDSQPAKEMVAHHLGLFDSTFAVELMGITAHVYADTFAHFGFSGLSSRLNRIAPGSIKLPDGAPVAQTFDKFMQKFGIQGGLRENFRSYVTTVVAEAAELTTGALGHGAVATYPDQPYLEWKYTYERPDLVITSEIERQNINDYVDAALALYTMFRRFADLRTDLIDDKGAVEFSKIKPVIREIVGVVADRDQRIAAWKKALEDGRLTLMPDTGVRDYDHTSWRNQMTQLPTLDRPEQASEFPVYHFYQAAEVHREFVLRDLLPNHGIYLI